MQYNPAPVALGAVIIKVLPGVVTVVVKLAAGKGVKGGAEPEGQLERKGATSEVTLVGSRGVSSITNGEYELMRRMNPSCRASAVRMEPATVR